MAFYFKALILPFILLCASASYWSTHGKPKEWILFPLVFVLWLGGGCVASIIRGIAIIWRAVTAVNPPSQWPH
jgi:hypothetical protein